MIKLSLANGICIALELNETKLKTCQPVNCEQARRGPPAPPGRPAARLSRSSLTMSVRIIVCAPLAKRGSERLGPRVYSMNASSRFRSSTSIDSGSSGFDALRAAASSKPTSTSSSVGADVPPADHAAAAGPVRRGCRGTRARPASPIRGSVGRAIDAQHAVDHDADAVGHALDVAQDVRAEQDRAALAAG